MRDVVILAPLLSRFCKTVSSELDHAGCIIFSAIVHSESVKALLALTVSK